MVNLIDIYNIKESAFSEIKKDRDPSRGNKGKSKEKDFYFIDEPADPETGAIRSKVVYKRSIKRMVEDYPNDFELGGKVRHYVRWLYERKQTNEKG